MNICGRLLEALAAVVGCDCDVSSMGIMHEYLTYTVQARILVHFDPVHDVH